MKRIHHRTFATTVGLTTVVPSAVAAHTGHAGDHGFLFSALQPLLAPDHLLAGLVVAGAGALLCGAAARVVRVSSRTRRS